MYRPIMYTTITTRSWFGRKRVTVGLPGRRLGISAFLMPGRSITGWTAGGAIESEPALWRSRSAQRRPTLAPRDAYAQLLRPHDGLVTIFVSCALSPHRLQRLAPGHGVGRRSIPDLFRTTLANRYSPNLLSGQVGLADELRQRAQRPTPKWLMTSAAAMLPSRPERSASSPSTTP